jgi:hypothetical protein
MIKMTITEEIVMIAEEEATETRREGETIEEAEAIRMIAEREEEGVVGPCLR